MNNEQWAMPLGGFVKKLFKSVSNGYVVSLNSTVATTVKLVNSSNSQLLHRISAVLPQKLRSCPLGKIALTFHK